MAVENENVPMIVDVRLGTRIILPTPLPKLLMRLWRKTTSLSTAAEMAAFETLVTPLSDLPLPTNSLMPPPSASSLADSPSASNNAESVSLRPVAFASNNAKSASLRPVASSSRVVAGVDEVEEFPPRRSCASCGL